MPPLDFQRPSDEDLDLLIGPEPEFEDEQPEEFDVGGLDHFLEGAADALSMARPPRKPRSFLEGLAYGTTRGLATRGQRVQEARGKFEQRQADQQKRRDQQRLRAQEKYGERKSDVIREAYKTHAAGKKDREKYERETRKLTPEDLKAQPWLARVADPEGRVSLDVMGKAFAPKEPRREDQGSYITVQTPTGPKLMRAAAAAAAGYVPLSAEPNAKPSTGEQKQALAYYNRARGAVAEVYDPAKPGASLEDRIADVARKNPAAAAFGQSAWNVLKGADRQRYEQAVSDFARSLLRKESGAAITPTEFADVERDYFVLVGDTPEKVAQKRRARDRVLEGLKFTAGPAYREFYGDEAAAPAGSAQSRAAMPKVAPKFTEGSRGRPAMTSFGAPD
jgi:hypothetical protein